MRIYTISDIHVDYRENLYWLNNLSQLDFKNDILILGGDVTDSLTLFETSMIALRRCFREVFFVPGNHDLWILRDHAKDSLEKFEQIKMIAQNCGIHMKAFRFGALWIVPLLGWYDFSFRQPSKEIYETWMDFSACQWPREWDVARITEYFVSLNTPFLNMKNRTHQDDVISFSHFLPRIDLLPPYIPENKKYLYPVLGSSLLEKQIRRLQSKIHVYGHSHVNSEIQKDHTLYVNNAFGYPHETGIAAKALKLIWEL